MKNSSKSIKDEDTSSISLMNYNNQDPENNDNAFLDDGNQVITGQVEKFRLLEEPHKFDELIESIRNGDLESLKSSIERMCKYCNIFSLFKNDNYIWKIRILN